MTKTIAVIVLVAAFVIMGIPLGIAMWMMAIDEIRARRKERKRQHNDSFRA